MNDTPPAANATAAAACAAAGATDTPLQVWRDGGIAHLRLNRPQQLNAIDVPLAQAFAAACRGLAGDATLRAVVLSGAGRAFGAGGDLASFVGEPTQAARDIIEPMHAAVLILTALDAPVIASLHGVVAGGSLSLALACDLAIAAEGTRFNLAYVNVAASCDVSGSYHLPRLVGLRQALQIALLGETFDAAEALRLGLINRVVPGAALPTETDALARRLAAGPTLALGRMKRLLRASLNNDLPTQLALESRAFQDSTQTQDFGEALTAFFAKRAPAFHGR